MLETVNVQIVDDKVDDIYTTAAKSTLLLKLRQYYLLFLKLLARPLFLKFSLIWKLAQQQQTDMAYFV